MDAYILRLNSLFAPKNSLLGLQKFPVSLRREFSCKPLNSLPDWARKIVQGAGIDKIPCYPSGQRWSTFLRNHMPHIAAMDLFVVPTIGFIQLYVLVIVRLARRELVRINVTAHPTAEWIAQQITEAFPWHEAPRYLIRDRDGIYGAAVTRRLRAMGIRDKPITPGSPWQNGVAERLIGTIRRECVDHVVALGEQHLRQVLKSYANNY